MQVERVKSEDFHIIHEFLIFQTQNIPESTIKEVYSGYSQRNSQHLIDRICESVYRRRYSADEGINLLSKGVALDLVFSNVPKGDERYHDDVNKKRKALRNLIQRRNYYYKNGESEEYENNIKFRRQPYQP